MPKFLADENFNNRVLRGLRRRLPELDLLLVRDVGLSATDDSVILEWAAQEDRVLLTQDVRTMAPAANRRLAAGQRMPGMVIAPKRLAIRRAIADGVILIECSLESEWDGQVRYLPL